MNNSNNMPKISIVIVNWNGKKWLGKCIDSLLRQTYKNIEIIVVDNQSTDDSLNYLQLNYPSVKTVLSDKNGGFAFGNNLGIKESSGEYILMLNNDTWIDVDFIERIYQKFLNSKADIVAPQEALYTGDMVDSIKWNIDILGHPVRMNFTSKKEPFYLCGVCLFFSKKMYITTGGLDEDFFMYFEETDWFWRLHLYKKKIVQLDDIFVYHAGAGSTNGGGMKYHNFLWRNQNTLQMLLKNYAGYNIIWILPVYFFQNIFEILFFLFLGKFKIAYSYIEGWIFNLKNINKIIQKRKQIQKRRMVSDIDIFRKMYFGSGKMAHLISFIKQGKQ